MVGEIKLNKCKECNHKFEWKKIYVSLWSNSWTEKFIKCSKCGTKHILTPRSRYAPSAFILLLPLMLSNLIRNYYQIPFTIFNAFIIVSTGLIFIILVSLIVPFFVRYERLKNINIDLECETKHLK
ncbi:TIGR04104 family putative zinc finger protein [Anaerobacillus arseniciselenatis]|uniref:TIGR04104 family putative zinc finger protein n=1 Tax=Anaerobacillus arseniciselenatis TaxID=85682 RepID=UPI0014708B13